MKHAVSPQESTKIPQVVALGLAVGLGLTACGGGEADATNKPVLDSSITNETNVTHCTVKPGQSVGTWVVRFLESDFKPTAPKPTASTETTPPIIGSASVYADSALTNLRAASATPDKWTYVQEPASYRTSHADPFNTPGKYSETYAIFDMDTPTALRIEVGSDVKPGCKVGQEIVSQHTFDRLQAQ